MNKNLHPHCSHEVASISWNCMKGHVICSKCSGGTSICPVCASSKFTCIFCSLQTTEITSHLNTTHAFEGPVFIQSSIEIEIKVDCSQYSINTIYKRNSDQGERLYALELNIVQDVLTMQLFSLGHNNENIRYRIKGKGEECIMFFSKTSEQKFVASLKQVRQMMSYINCTGVEVFCVEVEIGDEFFYL